MTVIEKFNGWLKHRWGTDAPQVGANGFGDMLKTAYDPQNAGHISGATGGVSSIGGTINLDGGASSTAPGGSINLKGSDSSGSAGGSINTSAGSGGQGGGINTSGGSNQGGSIFTSNGGGSIDTTGTGSIGLGVAGIRTTFTGTATADRAIALPDKSGTLATTGDFAAIMTAAGFTANAAGFAALLGYFGITPVADGTITPVTSETTTSGIVTALS